jgi:hypothetical protein
MARIGEIMNRYGISTSFKMSTWNRKKKIRHGRKTSGVGPIVGFGIRNVESSCSATIELACYRLFFKI